MAQTLQLSKITYFLGRCMPTSKTNTVKIQIKRLAMNQKYLMCYNHFECVYANDPNKLCKTGDTVLIKTLPQRLTRLINHEVVSIIYPLGDIVDPVTGKNIVSSQYRDELDRKSKTYGELESTFKYDEAPPRGRLENVRDFSHAKTYRKFHEDDTNPQAV